MKFKEENWKHGTNREPVRVSSTLIQATILTPSWRLAQWDCASNIICQLHLHTNNFRPHFTVELKPSDYAETQGVTEALSSLRLTGSLETSQVARCMEPLSKA